VTGADVLKISAPIIAMGGVWVARKALAGGYQAATGNQPPSADDLDAPLSSVLFFAAGAAVVAALVNTIVTREVTRATVKAEANKDLSALESV
jgi:Protein of unknown function (DUF4235)